MQLYARVHTHTSVCVLGYGLKSLTIITVEKQSEVPQPSLLEAPDLGILRWNKLPGGE